MAKYDWLPTECAPKNYPVMIVKGDFYLPDGSSLYIPDKRVVSNGWGEPGSIHIVGSATKVLPERLSITWYSFIERQFYKLDTMLPTARLADLFKEGYTSPVDGQQMTYHTIMVGMAPGDGIAVWVRGEQVTREVAFYEGRAAPVDWNLLMDNPDYPEERYVPMALSEVMDTGSMARALRNPKPDLFKLAYRKPYPWTPVFFGNVTATESTIRFFNGEKEYVPVVTKAPDTTASRTLPQHIAIWWTTAAGGKRTADIDFDEEETRAAFARLVGQEPVGPIQLQFHIDSESSSVKVYLTNKNTTIELLLCRVSIFSA